MAAQETAMMLAALPRVDELAEDEIDDRDQAEQDDQQRRVGDRAAGIAAHHADHDHEGDAAEDEDERRHAAASA